MCGISFPRPAGDQPVRLRVVDLAARDRADDALQLGRVHLVVARHHARHVDAARRERALVAGDDRGADAAVVLVDDHLDARVARRRARARPSRRARRRRRRRSRSTKPGMPASVSTISVSSSYAGTTTASVLPSITASTRTRNEHPDRAEAVAPGDLLALVVRRGRSRRSAARRCAACACRSCPVISGSIPNLSSRRSSERSTSMRNAL